MTWLQPVEWTLLVFKAAQPPKLPIHPVRYFQKMRTPKLTLVPADKRQSQVGVVVIGTILAYTFRNTLTDNFQSGLPIGQELSMDRYA